MKTSYTRVIPRDLFNEAKLLKCIGNLVLKIHDGLIPEKSNLLFHHDGGAFEISLLDEGALTIDNIEIWMGEGKSQRKFLFKTTYNSKSNYPLYVEHDYCDYRVFDEKGDFDDEFIEFCNNL